MSVVYVLFAVFYDLFLKRFYSVGLYLICNFISAIIGKLQLPQADLLVLLPVADVLVNAVCHILGKPNRDGIANDLFQVRLTAAKNKIFRKGLYQASFFGGKRS